MKPTDFKISITPAAIEHIKSVIAKNPSCTAFRLSMRKYGCNGYGYVPDVVQNPRDSDIEVVVTNQFRFFVDGAYANYMANTEIDYVVKPFGQEQLIFRNPNVEGECGCGESVNFKGELDE